jgi:rhodanese-related sulfurtransferase
VAQVLEENGFSDAHAVIGGFDAWMDAGLPIEPK